MGAPGGPRAALRSRERRPQPDPSARAERPSCSGFHARSRMACGRRRAAWRRWRTSLPDAYTVDVSFRKPILLPGAVTFGERDGALRRTSAPRTQRRSTSKGRSHHEPRRAQHGPGPAGPRPHRRIERRRPHRRAPAGRARPLPRHARRLPCRRRGGPHVHRRAQAGPGGAPRPRRRAPACSTSPRPRSSRCCRRRSARSRPSSCARPRSPPTRPAPPRRSCSRRRPSSA